MLIILALCNSAGWEGTSGVQEFSLLWSSKKVLRKPWLYENIQQTNEHQTVTIWLPDWVNKKTNKKQINNRTTLFLAIRTIQRQVLIILSSIHKAASYLKVKRIVLAYISLYTKPTSSNINHTRANFVRVFLNYLPHHNNFFLLS